MQKTGWKMTRFFELHAGGLCVQDFFNKIQLKEDLIWITNGLI